MTERDRPLRVILVGPPPTPPGGVASSVASIMEALSHREDVVLRVYRWSDLWRALLEPADVIHFNFSKSWKRMIGSLFGRAIGASVVHTIHGHRFNFRRPGNFVASRVSNGFILLNDDIYKRFLHLNVINSVMFTPILRPPSRPPLGNIDPMLLSAISDAGGLIAMVYAKDRTIIDGRDVYGFDFVVSVMDDITDLGYRVLFIDPSAAYSKQELDPKGSNLIVHWDSPVDFKALLKYCDIYIRPTSTDGSSIAVLEALNAGIPVLASDSVPRPSGVELFADRDAASFIQRLDNLKRREADVSPPRLTDPSEYVDFLRAVCRV